ncbi:DUF364 domain-containing protein [Caldivirga sp.]|jgi:uncharacterized protein (DUF4213/DUF364 family)|uniref:Rossmann-like domain-containing protein n=1 Tax=Caldivirga sp. TaxID=2080243 RepID=UPI0025BD786B|nr:DUF364 domain-containing protein [Caldivirga sp.]
MGNVIEFLVNYAREHDHEVRNVTIGVHWTCVWSRYCGVSLTYALSHDDEVRGFGRLEDKRASELAEYLRSWNLLEASVGLAAVNSVTRPEGNVKANGLDIALELSKGRRVTMVGAFPRLDAFRRVAGEFKVLELNPLLVNPGEGILPATAAEHVIPRSDFVIITASAIVNKSIDRLIELAKGAGAYVMLLGPSTPMIRDLLDYGIDILAGVRVNRPRSLIRKISQGCGMLTPGKLKGDVSFIVLSKLH